MDQMPEPRGAAFVLLALGLVSGGVGIAYEVVWTRELLNLLGSTTMASSVTLAAFMAGIALGAWLAGRWSEHVGEPLWLYILAEGLLAVIGFSFSAALGPIADAAPGSATFGVLIVLLLAPTFLMGVALPALAAALQRRGAVNLRYVAWLYGLNTLGGVVAALGAGFGALPAFGLAATGRATAVAGIVAAVAAAVLSLRLPPAANAGTVLEERPARHSLDGGRFELRAALFLSGVAALGYEVLWARILVLIVGSSTNAFSLMLGLYLLGLAVGGLWIGRRIGRIERPVATFQHLQIGVAVAAIAGVGLFGFLPGFALFGFSQLGTSRWSIAVVNGVLAAIVILPPTVLIGASLPVAARLLERPVPRRGRELGTALGLITAGNVVGVVATAFGVIPAVGLQRGVALLAFVNLAAAVLLWVRKPHPTERSRLFVPAAACGVIVFALLLPSWDRAVMTSGVFRQAPVYLALLGGAARLDRAFSAYRTLFYREGREAVVAVFDRPTLQGPPHRVLTIDGKVDASTGSDMATQVLSGQLPCLFRPDAERALVIGLASGVTVGALARHPVRRIDVVEIEPAVVPASLAFDEASGSPLKNPKVKLRIGDGRRYLRTASRRYDVIVSEPSNPWLSMSARLFTREFFELARERLAPGGVLVQWVPLYGLGESQFKSLLRTILDVFPELALFRVAKGDLVAVAGTESLAIRPATLDRLFRGASATALNGIGLGSPAELLARWVADARGLAGVLGPGPLNTDDNGLLEFGSPWFILTDTMPANLAVVERASASSTFVQGIVGAWSNRADGSALVREFAARHIAKGRLALVRRLARALRSRGRIADADLVSGDVAAAAGSWREAERFWRRHDTPAFLTRRGRAAFRTGRMAEAARLLDRAGRGRLPAEAGIIHALALSATGRRGEALDVLKAVGAEADGAAGILAPFLSAAVLADWRAKRPAARGRRNFEARLDGLRRCLETDGCRDTIDSLLAWGRSAPPGISPARWERFRQAIYVRVTRPLPLYMRGVSALWLGETTAARRSLRVYLDLLPAPDPLSNAHRLLGAAPAALRDNLVRTR